MHKGRYNFFLIGALQRCSSVYRTCCVPSGATRVQPGKSSKLSSSFSGLTKTNICLMESIITHGNECLNLVLSLMYLLYSFHSQSEAGHVSHLSPVHRNSVSVCSLDSVNNAETKTWLQRFQRLERAMHLSDPNNTGKV